jgi:putative oxidoreductase
MNFLNRYANTVYCLMRLIIGLLFACHGLDHVFGKFGGEPAAGGFFFIGGWIEVITGVLVAIGLLTRPAALIASGAMAVAYFKIHAAKGALPILNHGEAAVVYCWIFFFMFFYGPGRWSVDALIGRGRAAANTTS